MDVVIYCSIVLAGGTRTLLAVECNGVFSSRVHELGCSVHGAIGMSPSSRQFGLLTAQCSYAIALLLLCVRSIGMLKVNKSAGVLIIMIGEMIPEILIWSAVALCVTIGFSLFFTVVMAGDVLYGDDISWPAWQPFWGLLGDLQLEQLTTYNPPHVSDPASTLVPYFLWAYSFVATVVLINLLIAQMSSIFAKVPRSKHVLPPYVHPAPLPSLPINALDPDPNKRLIHTH